MSVNPRGLRYSAVSMEDLRKASRALVKRLNLKPRVRNNEVTNSAMLLLAMVDQLNRGQLFISLNSMVAQLAHYALDHRMADLESRLEAALIDPNRSAADVQIWAKELNNRREEHIQLMGAFKLMGVDPHADDVPPVRKGRKSPYSVH